MTRRIGLINEKGGSCKTTCTVNLAGFLGIEAKKKVLVVDTDPQGQIGKCFGLDTSDSNKTIYELLTNPQVKVEDVISNTPHENIKVLPSKKALSQFVQTYKAQQLDGLLDERLGQVKGFDYILVDTPPAVGPITRNVLKAVHEVIVPVSLTYLALDGCAEVEESIRQMRALRGGRYPRLLMIAPMLYRRTRLANEILSKLKEHFQEKLSKVVMGYSVKIDEAQSYGQTIFDYSPRSVGADFYRKLGREVERLGRATTRSRTRVVRPRL